MSTYSLRAAEVVQEYKQASYRMIDITITSVDGRFRSGALSYTVTASDGTATARSFMASLSPNGKEIHAFFTTDAFAAMPGPINFEFSYGAPIGTIANVNLPAIMTQLPAFIVAFGYPNADNALVDAP
jgi:hypothetical protein